MAYGRSNEMRAETAEQMHKQDAALRWAEVTNWRGWVQKHLITKDTRIYSSFEQFLYKFINFYSVTHFYISPKVSKKAEELFAEMDKNMIMYIKKGRLDFVRDTLKFFDEYANECFIHGMFLEPQITLDEGDLE